MIDARALTGEDGRWGLAAGVALVAHLAIGVLVLGWSRPAVSPMPEPVVLVELPPEAAPAPATASQQQQTQPEFIPPEILTPPINIPPIRAPLPRDPVTLPPPPPPLPARQTAPDTVAAPASTAPLVVARQGSGTGTSATAGNDPKARAQEADYFALVSAHLNRRKRYPTEAKKAQQQGVVTVRFVVARDGSVSGVSIKRSSGHELLDQATMELLRRVAPLPRMPASMKRDSVTLSLPIDYSLKTS